MDIPFVYPYDGEGSDDYIGEIRLYALFESYNEWLLDMVVPDNLERSSSLREIMFQANRLLRELNYVEFLLKKERDEWRKDTYIYYESELTSIRATLEAYYEPSIHILS